VQGNTIAGIAVSGAASGTSSSAPFAVFMLSGGLVNIGNVSGKHDRQSIGNRQYYLHLQLFKQQRRYWYV
jgi:hypothetical protein